LRPPVLYRAPLPRTKPEAVVPDGQVTGLLQVDGRAVSVSGWRGTAGHNWGSEHADSWVWLHAAGFGDHLAADVYAPGMRLRLSVTLAEDDRVAVPYADPDRAAVAARGVSLSIQGCPVWEVPEARRVRRAARPGT
jgi:hypothetical protein